MRMHSRNPKQLLYSRLNFSKSRESANVEMCVHCGKHGNSSKCYIKYPHLAPRGHPARAHLNETNNDTKALVAVQSANTTSPSENDFVCLLGMSTIQIVALRSFLHSASSSGHWIINSGCTSHVTFDRSAFASYTAASVVSNLDLGANSSDPLLDAVMSDWIYACLMGLLSHVL